MLARSSVTAFVTIMLFYGSTAVIASPFFMAESRVGVGGISEPALFSSSTDGSTVTSHSEKSGANRSASADAVAGAGFTGVSAGTFQLGLTGGASSANAGAEFTVSLFTTCPSGPPGAACAPSPTSMNFALGGLFSGLDPVGMNAEAYINVGVQVRTTSNQVISSQRGSIVVNTIPGVGTILREDLPPDGLLSGYLLNQNPFFFTTTDFLLQGDEEYRLTVFMNAVSQSPIRGQFSETSLSGLSVDFLHTLTFGAGPVFNGDLGFDISAPDANIFNNRWTDPRGVSNPVPAPATLALFGAGLGLMGLLRRRRKTRLGR